ncbi:hypothetical protein MKX34_24175 [Paenibacillus sp. FSL R5-0636]|uniref:hypothetical protein n=1 Tax=Paenibacillus TaxID=44249 RepID=UPI00117D8D2F|nr:hypothetical protein [Paenibacillus odorifer]
MKLQHIICRGGGTGRRTGLKRKRVFSFVNPHSITVSVRIPYASQTVFITLVLRIAKYGNLYACIRFIRHQPTNRTIGGVYLCPQNGNGALI